MYLALHLFSFLARDREKFSGIIRGGRSGRFVLGRQSDTNGSPTVLPWGVVFGLLLLLQLPMLHNVFAAKAVRCNARHETRRQVGYPTRHALYL